jgi:hypothetical protein
MDGGERGCWGGSLLCLCDSETSFLCEHTLIKKKIIFSSYIRKFRMEQLQSHIWLTASSYMGKYLRISSSLGSPSSYMTLQLLNSEFPYKWGKILFSFLSVNSPIVSRHKSPPPLKYEYNDDLPKKPLWFSLLNALFPNTWIRSGNIVIGGAQFFFCRLIWAPHTPYLRAYLCLWSLPVHC